METIRLTTGQAIVKWLQVDFVQLAQSMGAGAEKVEEAAGVAGSLRFSQEVGPGR